MSELKLSTHGSKSRLCWCLQSADQIAVLDAGKVVELGTHDDLMQQGGFYKRLISSQSLSLAR